MVFALVSVKSQYDVSIAIPVRFKQVELKLKGKNWSKGDVNDIVLGSVLLNRVAQYDSAYNWMLKAIMKEYMRQISKQKLFVSLSLPTCKNTVVATKLHCPII